MLWDDQSEEHIPYKQFSEWPDGGDAAFKDLIRGLTNLDPTKRVTARQALEHPWLADF
jgi:serine/threonine protein kinase